MNRHLSLSWRSARFGLRMVHLGILAVAYLSLVNSIVAVGTLPLVLSREYMGVAGFAAALLIGAVFFGILRGGWRAEVDYFNWLVIFCGGAVLVYFAAHFAPAALDQVLNIVVTLTRYVIYASLCALMLGFFYCLTAWGSMTTWLSAAASFVALTASALFVLVAHQVAWASPWVPDMLRGSILNRNPAVTALAFACVAIFLHTVYLKHMSRTVRESATSDYVSSYQRFHWIGSAIVLATVIWGSSHAVNPVVTFGGVQFDSFTVLLAAVRALVIAIAGIWLSRCVAGVGDLINPYRGHGVDRYT